VKNLPNLITLNETIVKIAQILTGKDYLGKSAMEGERETEKE
jgi:hypothetical protein